MKIEMCECVYPKLDEALMIRTNNKLPRYKCKKCDNYWVNIRRDENGN